MNLKALRLLYPELQVTGVEINHDAADESRKAIGSENVVEGSLFEWTGEPSELSFTQGVLIHLNPEMLPTAYERLYAGSSRFILVAEYYSPKPVSVPYRGHNDCLFKRDFAGEMLLPRTRRLTAHRTKCTRECGGTAVAHFFGDELQRLTATQ